MKIPEVCVIDFETFPIKRRPEYPPKPVGVSIKKPGERKPKYWAWGHPVLNNCDKRQGQRALQDACTSGYDLLFQNGKFDVDVACTYMECKMPSWDKIHDTMYLLFLCNPYQASLSLKPSAELLLDMPPDERDEVVEWLKKNKPNIREKNHKGDYIDWGAYIAYAPGALVGKYANGDTIRTDKLFKLQYPEVLERGMLDAYNRERRLMPILLRNEQEGIRTDLPLLEKDVVLYEKALASADAWLRKKLMRPNLNIDSDPEMADAFDRCGLVDEDSWILTATGKRSVSKKNLTPDLINDKRTAQVWGYRNKLATVLNTFQKSWLLQASATGGTIHTNWGQVRSTDHGSIGAATGRLTSSPNFQNIPNSFEDRKDGYVHPAFAKLPELPHMRKYALPDKGHIWIKRDWNQQELRLLAHFEDGHLKDAYLQNPKLDVHTIVQTGLIDIAHLDKIRTHVKNFVFQNIYGGGVPATCASLRVDEPTAKKAIKVLLDVLPGYKQLKKTIMAMGRHKDADGNFDQPIITWGGREYYAEKPRYVKAYNRFTTFEYKLVNYLIQGSGGDAAKEAIIRYDEHPKRESRFLVSVHDENNASSPAKRVKLEMQILRDVMESIETDVPLLSEGFAGPRWSDLVLHPE